MLVALDISSDNILVISTIDFLGGMTIEIIDVPFLVIIIMINILMSF
jgi:hypothetical protein